MIRSSNNFDEDKYDYQVLLKLGIYFLLQIYDKCFLLKAERDWSYHQLTGAYKYTSDMLLK